MLAAKTRMSLNVVGRTVRVGRDPGGVGEGGETVEAEIVLGSTSVPMNLSSGGPGASTEQRPAGSLNPPGIGFGSAGTGRWW